MPTTVMVKTKAAKPTLAQIVAVLGLEAFT